MTSIRTYSPGGILVLLGAGGSILGAVLPWATVSFGPLSVSASGIDAGDGWWFIGGAVVVLLLGLLTLAGGVHPGVPVAIVVAGLAGGALLGYEFHQVHRAQGVTFPIPQGTPASVLSGLFGVSFGSGLYVLAVSIAAVLAGGLIAGRQQARPARAALAAPLPVAASQPYAAFEPPDPDARPPTWY